MSTRRQFLRRTGYALAVAADGRLLAPQAGAAAVADPHCAQAAALPQPRAAAVGVPIVTQLWDGTTGVSGDWFNYGAALPWENQGGDWSDANAIAQGPTAFASMSFSSPGSSSASITTLARRWYAQGNTGVLLKPTNANAALVATRLNPDAALAPAVTLTLSDGTAWLLMGGFAAFGDWGLSFLHLGFFGEIWATIPYGIFLGVALLAFALAGSALTEWILAFATRRAERSG